MAKNHRYVDFPIEEARMGNLKGRFAQWATGRTVGILFGLADKVAVVGEPATPEQSKERESMQSMKKNGI